MPTIKPAGIEIFNQYSAVVNKTRKEIIAQDWFADDWWLNVFFTGAAINFQLSKLPWYNHNGQGIHIEFWLGETEVESKTMPFVLHFEPETPQRKELGEKFKEAFTPMAHEFDGYRVNHRAICDKLVKYEKFTKSGLPALVVREFSRLKEIAPVIDSILKV